MIKFLQKILMEKFLVRILVLHFVSLSIVVASRRTPNNRILQDGVEHIIALDELRETRLLFRMPTIGAPLWMFITPCRSNVHWQLFQTNYEHPQSQFPMSSMNFLLMNRMPAPLIGRDGNDIPEPMTLLAGEASDRRMSLYERHIGAAYVHLILTTDMTANVRVFLTTNKSQLDNYYPPLPSDTQLSYRSFESNVNDSERYGITVNWKIAPVIALANSRSLGDSGRLRYRYCAVVSRFRPDQTMCDELGEYMESIHCVNQSVNQMQLDRFRTGRRYFVTIFVRDQRTGGTSAMRPLEIWRPQLSSAEIRDTVTPAPEENGNKQHLTDAKLAIGKLMPEKGASLDYDFEISEVNASNSQQVLLVLHACDGYIRVAIFRNGKLLRRSDPFSGFRRFLVLNAQPSSMLRFQIINDDDKPKMFRLWASTQEERSPYPQLPDDTSIKEVHRTCSTITLQWLRSGNEQTRYCLYKRRESVNYLEELVSQHTDLCAGGLPEEHLVGCYDQDRPLAAAPSEQLTSDEDLLRHPGDEILDGIIETTVSDLDSDTTYRFDLLARPLQRPLSQELPYRTIWVKTKAYC